MNIALSLLLSAFISALGRIGIKLVTPQIFEAILTRVILWSGEHLAKMTTNTLDDEIVAEIKKRLNQPTDQP